MQLRKYLLFTLTVGTLTAFLSAVSDTLPYQDVTFDDTLIRFVAELMNDTITWLALSLLVGYSFCRTKRQALVAGIGFTVFSIIAYFLFGMLDLGYVPSTVQTNLVPSGAGEWLLVAAVGGAIGGLIGFTAKQHPSILLLFVAFIAMRMLVTRELTWQNAAGVIQNVIFIGAGLCIVVWVVAGWIHGLRTRHDDV